MSELADAILAGNRRALARGITVVESTRPDHRDEADTLLADLLPHAGRSLRVGISGAPGTGKSTFIEALGLHTVRAGHRVAVLAVDPSSARTGGSILGDKTRMEQLARHPDAFIRPSPTSGTLGGVARHTRETIVLCEAAGFDVVLVETVGVGQSEVAVAEMVDCFLLLLAPGGGDDLQGIKRGIMELADLVVVNKADGPLRPIAEATASEYGTALHLVRPRHAEWTAEVLTCSALEQRGIDTVWEALTRFRAAIGDAGLARLRRAQDRDWMRAELTAALLDRLRHDARTGTRAVELEAEVAAGRLSPTTAARRLLAEFLPEQAPRSQAE